MCSPLELSPEQSTLHSSSPASQLPHLIHHLVSTLPPKHLQLDSFFCPYCTCPRPGFHHLPSSCCKVSSSGPLSCPPSIHSLCRDQHCFPNASHPPPFFFTALSGLWDFSSLTRDEPQPLVMKSAESLKMLSWREFMDRKLCMSVCALFSKMDTTIFLVP